MNLTQFLSILRARRMLFLAIFLGTIALALAWVLLRPSYYTARAPILVDIRSQDPLAQPTYQSIVPAAYMATQIDIARSDRVAERVVDMLGLEKDPKSVEDWKKATGGRGNLKAWLASDLQAGLEVKPARESNIINVTWTGRSPQEAAKVANAFSQAYLDIALDIKTDPAKKYASWFDEQLKFARDRLEQAQGRLTAYQQKTGVISADGIDMETQRLNELSSQLTMVQGQLTDVANKRNAGASSVAETMSSPLINSLKADIARQEARIQEASANLGARHPQMIRMQDELRAMKSRLGAETGSIGSSINTAYEVGRARERELQGAVNAQRARVMQFNRYRDELSVLRKDVDTAQKAYEAVAERASQSKLQALTNQTNIQRLATAIEPLEAKGPTTKVALAVAAAIGLLLALAGAILMELLNRRVRSVDDLSLATHLPILATVPAHNGAAALARLAHAPSRPALAYRGSVA
ncbi:chain length determinant protein EpsF [Ramlibacter sp. MMS24-I3-19]|uniref:chain length determinant protein EpsF n=1 Tax=Ramlibacter sp. MMS24-I3-19 TaxID=3416606 RepID=UPI003D08581A